MTKSKCAKGLFIVLFVLTISYLERQKANSWKYPLAVLIYPINKQGSESVRRYLNTESDTTLAEVDAILAREARRYHIHPLPVTETHGEAPVTVLPPEFPATKNMFRSLLWQIQFEWWAQRYTPTHTLKESVFRLYLIYHPLTRRLPSQHLGLSLLGSAGILETYGSPLSLQQNHRLIARELLRLLGGKQTQPPFKKFTG